MKRPSWIVLSSLLAFAAFAGPAEHLRESGESDGAVSRGISVVEPGPIASPAPVVNRVIDLLDAPAELSTAQAATQTWESRPFRTSQYNRIGLRFSSENESGYVSCGVCWRYAATDACQDGLPIVVHAPPDDGASGAGEPTGGVGLVRTRLFYGVIGPTTDFSEVRGLEAQVRCTMLVSLADFGIVQIGDDPNQAGDGTEPTNISASLTDVKVLLRRD